ncbi:MAG: Coenzyme F420 hydrogenase/dehydrogenase, beta subunit C-terminal domain [Promethearchaeota archaeon]
MFDFRLETEVIFKDRCIFCGACVTVCDKIRMDREAEAAEFDQVCASVAEKCLDICPRLSLDVQSLETSLFGEQRTDLALGVYKKTVRARSKDSEIVKRAQSGGVVSSLLISALENGIIDAAVVTSSDFTKGENPYPIVANSKEDILAASGSKYTPCPVILGLKQAVDQGYQRIAFVGLPCHIEALRKLQTSQFDIMDMNRVSLVIGLFCCESFSHSAFMQISKAIVGDEKIWKFDIKGSKFYIYTDTRTHTIPLKRIDTYARNACKECLDYSAELADLSVGSVGSPDGYSSIIIRSEHGLQVVNSAAKQGYIEIQDMNPKDIDTIRQQAAKKRKAGVQESQ